MSKSPNSSSDQRPSVLFVATCWPEYRASAAGVRLWSFIKAFKKSEWKIGYVSSSKPTLHMKELKEIGVEVACIQPNSSRFDSFIKKFNPQVCIFDRFVMEEQFGWRVKTHAPHCARILDTQDLHFVRKRRQRMILAGQSVSDAVSEHFLEFDQDMIRELSSIHRSDHVFVVSDWEKTLLENRFQIPPNKISLASFYYPKPDSTGLSFTVRQDFSMLGSFRHPPNRDGFFYLKEKIWPRIRNFCGSAELHSFGAFPTKEVMSENDPEIGFWVKGPIEDSQESFRRFRVSLAPLRFGAGIKGKIAESWLSGTPVVTTSIGAEGMRLSDGSFGGLIADNELEFSEAAVRLYTHEDLWLEKQALGFRILSEKFNESRNSEHLLNDVQKAKDCLPLIRSTNTIGEILWYEGHRSTEYFSRWIEAKQPQVIDSSLHAAL